MATSNSIILIIFTLVWLISLFALALATPDVADGNNNLDDFYHYTNEAYNMIPPNAVIIIALTSLVFISKFLFRL